MKKTLILKKIAIYLSISYSTQVILAQVSLSSVTNSLRHGDILCRVELPYADAGERGEDAVWTMPVIPEDASDHLQAIRSNGDTTVIYETGRMLHYG